MAEPLVDIIIASLKQEGERPAHLCLCLETVHHFTDVPHRILLEESLDSASINRNRALAKSTAPYVCFLDDDAWVTPGWCSSLLAVMESDPSVGMVGPKIKLETGRIFCFGIGYRPLADLFPIGYGTEDRELYDSTIEPFAIPTTCLLVRREALEAVGLFDTTYETCQWEDLDFYMRLRLAGFRGLVTGCATVYHSHLFRSSHFIDNSSIFYERWSKQFGALVPMERQDTSLCYLEAVHGTAELRRKLQQKRPTAELTPLGKLKPGHPSVWLWRTLSGVALVIKYAPAEEQDANAMLAREYNSLTVLAGSGVISSYIVPMMEGDHIVGIVTSHIHSDSSIRGTSPAMLGAAAAAFARMHKCTWRIPYPPFGVRVPVLMGGHAFWIGGERIALQLCERLRETSNHKIAADVSEAISWLKKRREALTRPFSLEEMVLIHGDISRENVLYSRDGERILPIFIDFGESVVGPVQHDLARYCISMHLTWDEDEVLLSQYLDRFEELTGFRFDPIRFRAGFEASKCLALFDLQIFGPAANLLSAGSDEPQEGIITSVRESVEQLKELLRCLDEGNADLQLLPSS